MNRRILLFILAFAGFYSLYSQDILEINSQFQFIENNGQWPEQVNFRAEVPGGFIWLEKDKFNYQFRKFPHVHGHSLEEIEGKDLTVKQHVLWAEFIGCNKNAQIQSQKKSSDYYNYFIGNNKNKWASYCYAYSDITYKKLYDGIDMRIYEKNLDLKYDFTLEPNAKNIIQVKYSGQDRIRLNKKGNLIIETSLGQIIEEKPYAYQIKNGKLIQVACAFVLKQDILTFNLGEYDKNYKLVIDPVLVFASYSGSYSDNFGMTATYDNDGNMFAGGMAYGNGYPTTPGAYDGTGTIPVQDGPQYGVTDVVITKYNETGTSRIYSTYLGGGNQSLGTETVHSLIADSTGNLYFFGVTSSLDFPVTSNAIQNNNNGGDFVGFYQNGTYFISENFGHPTYNGGTDFYISKLDPNGANLLASTYLGGSMNDGINYNLNQYNVFFGSQYASSADSLSWNYGDQFRGEIMLDDSLNIYVASCTRSPDFPTKNAYQNTLNGLYNAVVFKFDNNLDSLVFSTFLGGSTKDAAYSIKINELNQVVVAGGTASNDFPVTTNAYQGSFQGGKADGFISILDSNGSYLASSTYFGTSAYDQNFFVEIDRWEKVFTVGQTLGNTPTSTNVYSNPNSPQFLTKFNEDLSVLELSTKFGNGNNAQTNISPAAFLVDFCGNTYVSGWGTDFNSTVPMTGMPLTPNAFQTTTTNRDFYLIVLSRDFENLIYGSYIGGGSADEHVDGGTSRFDKNGIVYQSVCGGCQGNSDFPTTPGAVSDSNRSDNCNNLVFKFDFEIVPRAEFSPDITEGCAPFTVQFMNTSSDSSNYLWDFGDGDTTSQIYNPIKVYDTPGIYKVKLLVTDTICLLVDTAEVTLTVYDSLLIDAMNDTTICGPATFDIWATSYGSSVEFQWSSTNQFLDTLNADLTDSVLTISPGIPQYYYVRITNPWCTEIDSVYIDFVGDALEMTPDTNICLGDVINISAINESPSITFTYVWQPASEIISGQGTSTITVSPDSNTTFTLTATSSNNCIITNTVDVNVYYLDPNEVYATAQHDTIYNGGTTYLYGFPDTNDIEYVWFPPLGLDDPYIQSPLATPEMTTDYYLFVKKGGCSDTGFVKITVLENICDDPTVFIPNAFTPNYDGVNDEVLVRGDNIEIMRFRIFDRWGEMVFESEDQTLGWDGTFKGKMMNPDVYVYYLDVTCVGGDEQLIKGNITIIR